MSVQIGLEVLLRERSDLLRGRAGLVTHAAAILPDLTGTPEALLRAQAPLVALFGPEHGLDGAAAAGAHVGDQRESAGGLPVYSLYGETRRPTAAMLDGLETLLFDMQDVGARFYTYVSTLIEVMRAAEQADLALVVLDRPNPIGGRRVEGPRLTPGWESFIGALDVPVRHALTIGEAALLARARLAPRLRLEVVPMRGWRRGMRFARTGLPWAPPSPNMPRPETALLYPGTCLLEGTNLSCGRGTALPFEVAGAPWLDGRALAAQLNSLDLPGARFRALRFTPLADRFAGQVCGGVQLHVSDWAALRPVALGLHLVDAIRRQHPGDFTWEREHFDRLCGGPQAREALVAGELAAQVARGWAPGEAAFRRERAEFLLYS